MEWHEVFLVKLIGARRNQSFLWDSLDKDDYKKHSKRNAWREIFAKVNLPSNFIL